MRRRLALLSALWALAACHGREGPAAPTPVEAASEAAGAPTLLSFVSGETAEPVRDATVLLDGRTYTTDPSGQITLGEAPSGHGAPLTVAAAGFLQRRTLLNSNRFSLWPRASPTGLDEESTARMVYNCSASRCAGGGEPLLRVLDPRVLVVPSPELRDDDDALESLRAAAEGVSAATHGEVVFTVSPSASQLGVVVTASIDPADPDILARDAAAVTKRYLGPRGNIIGAAIVIRNAELARRHPLLLHELGHAFGLGHSPRLGDVMWGGPELYGAHDFSPRERLSIGLMLQRLPGNRFPDDDARGAAAAASGVSIIACGRD